MRRDRMSALTKETLTADGAQFSFLHAPGGDALPVLFLHGGAPGVTPYCAGKHIWGEALELFAARRPVIAPDLPGAGETPLQNGEAPTLEGAGERLLAALNQWTSKRAHLVGHAEGGLLALWMAQQAPHRIASVSVVASPSAAPSGDALPIMALDHPPAPLWSRLSQRWALEQASCAYAHIDGALLDACVAAANGVHRASADAAARDPAFRSAMAQSVGRIKTKFFETYRGRGVAVPVQVLWGSDDPLSGVDRGSALFQLVATKQPTAAFDVVNRAGHFPFREEPKAFFDYIDAWQEAVETKARRSTAAA
jgi:pimeloyl-ACP methyl ester carboxylesterase